jgi:peptide/nickel transport system permease protein
MSVSTAAPSRAAGLPLVSRLAAFRTEGFPTFPIAILVVLVLTAACADFIAPHNPEVGSLSQRFKPPAWVAGGSSEHWLGTDHIGRDVLSRLIFGARVSMIVGFTAVVFAGVIGTALGILSGYFGGWVDQVIMRITDTWLALPALTFAIFLAAIVGPSEWNIVVILGAVYWTRYARVIRGEVLSLRERDYVLAARALGASHARIMVRHLLPGVVPGVIVLSALGMSGAIVVDAGLSYLGLGVPLPTPSWGRMVSDAQTYIAVAPWLVVCPGIAIALAVVGFNLIGYGLIDVMGRRR